ncbi:MAG: aldose epimerase family protein [Amaricoccus sp.]|uniref:aldose epimerase family protein n=1 Tax=Amaricoccus sp. TaxID=1872485 RepID=UPI0039E2C827
MRKRLFGRTDDGHAVDEVVLESSAAAISVLSLGCIMRDWRVDGPRGSLPMLLGFPTLEGYLHRARSHGAIVGRVANRTAGAAFELDGQRFELTANDGRNHLHGGTMGLGRRIWDMEVERASNTVFLAYASPDGEQGYPGAVDFRVSLKLDGPRLVCEMSGLPDRPTPVNLANHNYYNLGGSGTVQDHVLVLGADRYTPVDAELIPTGELRSVEGTDLDFTEEREIGDRKIDHNLVLRDDRDRKRPAARMLCPRTGRKLDLWTDEPGLQVFNAFNMTIPGTGLDGQTYGPYAGICLEAQHFPDTLHHPEWPGIIATPEAPYFQRLVVEIGQA